MLYAVKDTRTGTVSNWHPDREGTQRACNNANFRHNRILERCGQKPESPFVVVERPDAQTPAV